MDDTKISPIAMASQLVDQICVPGTQSDFLVRQWDRLVSQSMRERDFATATEMVEYARRQKHPQPYFADRIRCRGMIEEKQNNERQRLARETVPVSVLSRRKIVAVTASALGATALATILGRGLTEHNPNP